jgi:hypothetical protein
VLSVVCRQRVFESSGIGRISKPKTEEVAGYWVKGA